jgi:DNA-binding winged helix-turn-helix (wHTH) protein/TolB-like protein/Tfp pilus assembly protein PilF
MDKDKPLISNDLYAFGIFHLDTGAEQLFARRERVKIAPKVYECLVLLVKSEGKLVSKNEFFEKVWVGTFVEDSSLSYTISQLRKLLAEYDADTNYIETVPRRGFRFNNEIVQTVKTPEIVFEREIVTEEYFEEIFDENGFQTIRGKDDEIIISPGQNLTTDNSQTKKRLQLKGKTASNRNRLMLVSMAVLLVLLAVGFSVWKYRNDQTKISLKDIRSIAVLPIKSFDKSQDDEHRRLLMTDSLITKLGKIDTISIRPTASILKYANVETESLDIGKELGVDAIIDGRIQQEGEKIRINIQLISVSNGENIWSEQFDGNAGNLLGLQDLISANLVKHLDLTLTKEQEKIFAKQPTKNADAYEAYLRGRYFWNLRTGKNFVKAISEFEEAVKLDPDFALAYAGLGDCYALLGVYDEKPPLESYPKAKEFAKKALELDANLAEAHTTLAFVRYRYEWNWKAAENGFKKAILLQPNYATAHHWYGEFLMASGRFDEGEIAFKEALRIDPLSLIINTDLGYGRFFARRYDESISQYEKVIRLNPEFTISYYCLADALSQKKEFEKSVDAFGVWMKQADFQKADIDEMQSAFVKKGYEGYLQSRLKWSEKEAAKKYFTKFDVARFYADSNRTDEAIEWLEKALAENSADLVFINVHPSFDKLKDRPKFQQILKKMNLLV